MRLWSADHLHERLQGHSKMSGHIVREALFMVWRLWLQNGCRRKPRLKTS